MKRWPYVTVTDFVFIMVMLQIKTTTGFADVPIIPGRADQPRKE